MYMITDKLEAFKMTLVRQASLLGMRAYDLGASVYYGGAYNYYIAYETEQGFYLSRTQTQWQDVDTDRLTVASVQMMYALDYEVDGVRHYDNRMYMRLEEEGNVLCFADYHTCVSLVTGRVWQLTAAYVRHTTGDALSHKMPIPKCLMPGIKEFLCDINFVGKRNDS